MIRIDLTEKQKKSIVEYFQNNNFISMVEYLIELDIIEEDIGQEYIDKAVIFPYQDEENYFEYDNEIVIDLFDYLNITEEDFKKYTKELEKGV